MPRVEDVGGVPQGAADVVGHRHDGDALLLVQIVQRAVQLLRRRRVKPRHRLIQYQQLPGGAQRPRQQHPLLLPAGQFPVAAILQLQHAQLAHVHQRLGLLLGRVEKPHAPAAEKAAAHHLRHRGGEVLLRLRLLGRIADSAGAQGGCAHDLARHGAQQPQQALHQRGLAAAVFTHDAHIVAAVHLKAQVLPHRPALVAQRHVPAVQQYLFLHQDSPSFNTAALAVIRLI